ncbi:MAG TPA: hypothetical protein VMG30_05850 [Acidobacteriota bacterium]|nr:hypothetical protein [Acidobacteriota bacterium]
MGNRIFAIPNDDQDRSSEAWDHLCAYVEAVAADGRDEFSPLQNLGAELFAQIHTLPETISKLKAVKKLWLYGSKLKRIPIAFRQPGGSHVIFRHSNGAMLSVPAHRPIKPVYIKKFVRLVEYGVSE